MPIAQKIATSAAKVTKQTASDIAKRIAQEHLETLKSARQQVAPVPESGPRTHSVEQIPTQPTPEEISNQNAYAQLEAKIKSDSARLLSQLEGELKQIRIKKEQEDLYKKQQEAQQQMQVVEVKQEEKKRESLFQKVTKKIKGRIAGKREQQKNVSG